MFGPLSGGPAVDREVDDAAWLRALLDVERALAAAQEKAGLVPAEAARAIAECATPDRFDLADLGRRAARSASPVVPLVQDLTALVPQPAAAFVHLGATSQDVLDTAASLVARRALVHVLGDLAAAADSCAAAARAHRDTVMVGRTMLQHAVPTTYGLKCAGWLVALDEAHAGLVAAGDRLAVQLGGAAGTLAPLGEAGIDVAGRLASLLGLDEPVLPWHTNRVRVGELAGALGVAVGVLGKIALDVLLLAQPEVGEVAEAAEEGRGGSSAMPHKRNPVRAVLVSAATRRVPGLVATLLATMPQEHERAAGAWQAEWETLRELLRLVGGAAAGTRDLLAGLRVDPERMRRNLSLTDGLVMAEAVAARLTPALGRPAAHELLARASRTAIEQRRPLRAVLLDEPAVRAHLSAAELDAALDPAANLGSAGAFVDRALAAHEKRHGS
ncbi:MAG: 3-carboxy-cis,cis-muconate cycloisomerase [Actinobacteria bacterium 13_2_20CM_2_71_6]|nr:MAG: 3-carboxy-cis,cis-muconate cycloisomerase [Actinobacteria bacterium 13_2_20CM_2_71_6]